MYDKNAKETLNILFVSGLKGSGKDYVTDQLLYIMPYSHRAVFADAIKSILSKSLNVTVEELNYNKNHGQLRAFIKYRRVIHLAIDFRALLNTFGHDVMKPWFGETVWVDKVVERLPKAGVVILSDWRYHIEIDTIRSARPDANIITIRVDDYNLDAGEHSAEREIAEYPFDIRIDNTSKFGRWNIMEDLYTIRSLLK